MSHIEAPERCDCCRFWSQDGYPESKKAADRELFGEESGTCRRYPPALIPGEKICSSDHPTESHVVPARASAQ